MNSRYKAVKETVRNYYKYVDTPWTQPVLTQNGTMGGDDFAVYSTQQNASRAIWYAFDNNDSTFWHSSSISTPSFYIYNPQPLNITNIHFYNASDTYTHCATAGTVYGSNDGVDYTPITNFTNSSYGNNATWDLDLSSNTNYYKYYQIYASTIITSPYGWAARSITITAIERTIISGTSLDYDYYVDVEQYKAVKTIDRKYYKLLPWTQPVLSANGTMGGDSFACIASNEYTISGTTYYAYKALDADSSTNWLTGTYSNTDLPIYLTVYNPEPLNVTSMIVTNRGTYNTYATEGNVYASNDGNNYTLLQSFTNSVSGKNSTWTIDLSSNSGAYKYYKLEITAGVWDKSKSNGMGISELQITANQVIEVTEQDYDFYKDVEQYKAILD